MLEALRSILADPELAEARIAQRVSKRRPTLLEDLCRCATKSTRARGRIESQAAKSTAAITVLPVPVADDEQISVSSVTPSDLDLLE